MTKSRTLNPQEAQPKSRRQLRLLMDALPVLIAYVDREQRYRFTNRAHQEWFAYRPAEIDGMTMRQVLDEAVYQALQPHVRKVLSGQSVRFEVVLQHPKRGMRHICATYVPDVVRSGETQGFFTLDMDTTEIRRADRAQQRRLDEIAHAARLSAMQELTTQIAHEVSQPLSAIASFCEAGSRMVTTGKAEAAEIAGVLADIASEAERAANIIREVRHLLSKRQPRFEQVPVNELVNDMLRLVRIEAAWHGVEIRVEEDPSVGRVKLDRVLIEQVVFNLMHNAMDAMKAKPREQRIIVVRTRRRPDRTVEVHFRDSGTGLSVDFGERIFDPFFTTKASGMGMGLAICRSIIEMHGGRLWATPNSDGGTTFHFTLAASDETNSNRSA